MADEYGLSAEGFKQKRLTDIIQSMNSRISDQLGVQIATEPNSVFGQLVGVFAYEIADLWEQAGQVYGAMYPHTASGVSLDNASALAGISPIQAEKTTVICTCYGINGTMIPYGSQIGSQNLTFECAETSAYIDTSKASYVGVSVPSVVVGNAYSVTIDGTIYSYTAVTDDTPSLVLTGIGSQISVAGITASVNNDVLEISTDDQQESFDFIASSNLNIDSVGSPVKFVCTEVGAINPAIGTLTTIITNYAGWESVNNLVPANVGREAETDTALRQRWNSSLYTRSIAMVDSIASALMLLNGVTSATVYENDTDSIDADGRPPHSIEAVVSGGDADAIGLAIWQKKSAGIDTYGSQSVSVTDSQGFAHNINFNRPLPIDVWLNIAVTEYPEESLPSDASTRIIDAVMNYASTLTVGNDVILQRFMGEIYRNVSGIGYITITASTDGVTYTANNIPISAREIAIFDESKVQVTIS